MAELYFTNERYIAALKRIKDQIEKGSKLIAVDSTEIGNKYTECSWGLCSDSREQFPDDEDRCLENLRYKKYFANGQHCPFDKDQDPESLTWGCFYRCKIFQDKLENRNEAIELYNITLEKIS